jgi:hypothetical protein
MHERALRLQHSSGVARLHTARSVAMRQKAGLHFCGMDFNVDEQCERIFIPVSTASCRPFGFTT